MGFVQTRPGLLFTFASPVAPAVNDCFLDRGTMRRARNLMNVTMSLKNFAETTRQSTVGQRKWASSNRMQRRTGGTYSGLLANLSPVPVDAYRFAIDLALHLSNASNLASYQ